MLAVALIVSGCGSSSRSSRPAAQVAGQAIAWQDVRSNVSYAARFYAPTTSLSRCSNTSMSRFCTALTRQVLERLIEERVIEIYAARHGIALTAADQRRAARMTVVLLARKRVTGTDQSNPPSRMLGAIVRRELLVQHVQAAVTSSVAVSGPSYHLRRYLAPRVGSAHQTYLEANQFALGASPPPPGTLIRTEWKASFRISPALRAILRDAHSGQYVGPFKRAGGYEVIEVLDQSRHRYGAKARGSLMARHFATWLQAQVLSAHPICYSANGRETSCPHP